MDPEELQWLYETAQKMKSIVEIGSFEGRSTYVLLAGCPGPVYSVDFHYCGTMHPFQDNEIYTRPDLERNCGHFSNLVIVEMSSEEAAKSPLIPPMVDMVFIDGDHNFAGVFKDLELWAPRVNCMISGHDLCSETPGVAQALDKYFGLPRIARGPKTIWFTTYPNGGEPWKSLGR
jgi:hypothetical protein